MKILEYLFQKKKLEGREGGRKRRLEGREGGRGEGRKEWLWNISLPSANIKSVKCTYKIKSHMILL